MQNHHVPISVTISAVLWTLGATLIIIQLANGMLTGQLGLLIAGSAGVLNIRTFILETHHREENAFDLGVAAGRVQAQQQTHLTSIH